MCSGFSFRPTQHLVDSLANCLLLIAIEILISNGFGLKPSCFLLQRLLAPAEFFTVVTLKQNTKLQCTYSIRSGPELEVKSKQNVVRKQRTWQTLNLKGPLPLSLSCLLYPFVEAELSLNKTPCIFKSLINKQPETASHCTHWK